MTPYLLKISPYLSSADHWRLDEAVMYTQSEKSRSSSNSQTSSHTHVCYHYAVIEPRLYATSALYQSAVKIETPG